MRLTRRPFLVRVMLRVMTDPAVMQSGSSSSTTAGSKGERENELKSGKLRWRKRRRRRRRRRREEKGRGGGREIRMKLVGSTFCSYFNVNVRVPSTHGNDVQVFLIGQAADKCSPLNVCHGSKLLYAANVTLREKEGERKGGRERHGERNSSSDRGNT